ncbi:hypothetical protein EX30DRAFT_49586 [Ascodesmis nigricans]|uniref:NACHT domain-containing protein n=1 Tax=Ascodesmis nigricans TaxID=341454 RepID=A0A4S2MW05_9PEZI|nr:hypothetical protein EX30DRAFT_49586 [Ascodesmis nigricans]
MLWRVLHRIIEDATTGKICLLVDALDKCEEESRTALLQRLKGLTSNGSTKQRLKLVITSRPHVRVNSYLQDIVQIPLGASNLTSEITSFVEAEVQKLPRYGKYLLQEIEQTLIEGANGMFLWVSLVLDDLKKSSTTTPQKIRHKLQTLPKDLPEVYIKILRQVPADSEKEAQTILRWVARAKQPLTIAELTLATAVRPNNISMTDILDHMETDMKAVIQMLFGPMLRIDNDYTVHVVHQSARGFFLDMGRDTYGDPLLSAFHLPRADPHLHIAVTCITYLSFDECREGSLGGGCFWWDDTVRHNVDRNHERETGTFSLRYISLA